MSENNNKYFRSPETQLIDIEKQLKKGEKRSSAMIGMNAGVFAMALALNFIPVRFSIPTAWTLYIVGLGGFLVSFFFLIKIGKSKSNS